MDSRRRERGNSDHEYYYYLCHNCRWKWSIRPRRRTRSTGAVPVPKRSYILTLGIAFDSAGNAYIADSNNYALRKLNTTFYVSTLAGNSLDSGSRDGSYSYARYSDLKVGLR